MDAYEILLKSHRIGSKISGTVIACDEPSFGDGMVVGDVRVKTETAYPALLPYSQMVDEPSSFTPNMVPRVGARIDAVVFNFVDGTLYLSAKPEDLSEATIRKWREYYDYIETLTIGSALKGRVEKVAPFGLFVDIGGPFVGLIEIAYKRYSGDVQLPRNQADWPKPGDETQCTIGYFRIHNQQIGLGWLPGNPA